MVFEIIFQSKTEKKIQKGPLRHTEMFQSRIFAPMDFSQQNIREKSEPKILPAKIGCSFIINQTKMNY